MSSDVIQAKYDELDAIARRFGQRAQLIAELRNQVQRSAQPLEQGGWQGRGSAAFFGELNLQLVPATQRLRQALEEARSVTLEVSAIIRRAEQEAAAPFRGAAFESSNRATGAAAFAGATASAMAGGGSGGFLDGVGDFFGGMYAEGKDMVHGLVNMVIHPVDTAKGIAYAVTHPGELWDALKQPYVDDWNNGHEWRAIGRGTMFVVSIVVGAKGLDKAAKAAGIAGKAGRVGEAAGAAGKAGEAAGAAGKVGEAAGAAGKAGEAGQAAGRLVNTTGRVLSAEEGVIARQLVGEGRVVEVLAESTQQGVRTADFVVDGTRTELKTISNITSKDVSGSVARRALDGAGQAPHLILDTRGQAGFTRELADRAIRRAYGADKTGRIRHIRIIGDGFDLEVPRIP